MKHPSKVKIVSNGYPEGTHLLVDGEKIDLSIASIDIQSTPNSLVTATIVLIDVELDVDVERGHAKFVRTP